MTQSVSRGDGNPPAASLPAEAFQAQETVLPNGLRLLVLEDHAAPVVSFQVHLAAGSRNERPGITGISHLFEHMMFKGTPRHGPEEFARVLQAQGGQVNAFTTEDSTCYYENLPAHALGLAIELEADRQANLLLTEANLASEREVVRNERLVRTVNTPYGLAREQLLGLAYQQHPYRWPVVGWDADLVALRLEDCRAYFETYYAAGNTTLVAAGDLDPARVREQVEEAYGSLPSRPEPPPVVAVEPPQRGERRGVHRKDLQAPALFAAFHAPAARHDDTAPLLVLAAVLSGGRSSRFHRRFVRTGRAGAVHADLGSSFLNRDPSLFHMNAVANPGDDLERLEAEIWDEVDRLQQQGVHPDEVRRAARQILADLILRAQTCFYRGLQLGLYQIRAGDWRFPARFAGAVGRVTAADVDRVARAYLSADNRTVVSVLPEPA